MTRNRMEAFSDGVLAIVITIMVLKLQTPKEVTLLGLSEILPTLLAYILSYIYVGIYWVNHHHLVSVVNRISGRVLWRNLHWLFWMTLIPLATEWMGLNSLTNFPTFFYGVILFMCALSYNMLQTEIIKIIGKDSKVAKSIGKDHKGKISIVFYGLAMIFANFIPLIAYLIYAGIALLWIVPDKRIEKAMHEE